MRRGIALSIDAAVAMTIAVFGFSFLALSSSNIRPSFDSSAQVQLASADIYRALSQTTLAELEAASPTIAGMHADGTLSDSDMAMTEMALLAKLNWEGTAQSRDYATRVINETVAPLLTGGLRFSVAMDGTVLFNSTTAPSDRTVSATKGYAYSRNSTAPFANPIGPVEATVGTWV